MLKSGDIAGAQNGPVMTRSPNTISAVAKPIATAPRQPDKIGAGRGGGFCGALSGGGSGAASLIACPAA